MLISYIFSEVLDQRDKLYGEVAEYLQLKTVIERIKVYSVSMNSFQMCPGVYFCQV
jgi:hypothetical protein